MFMNWVTNGRVERAGLMPASPKPTGKPPVAGPATGSPKQTATKSTPNKTPGKSKPTTSSGTLDLGNKPLRAFREQGFQDKIKKWQTEGGGIVEPEKVEDPAEDNGSDKIDGAKSKSQTNSRPTTPAKSKASTNTDQAQKDKKDDANTASAGAEDNSKELKPTTDNGANSEKKVKSPVSSTPAKKPAPKKKATSTPRRGVPKSNELDEDVRIATTPKKRVVSDSHWRKNKDTAKKSTEKETTDTVEKGAQPKEGDETKETTGEDAQPSEKEKEKAKPTVKRPVGWVRPARPKPAKPKEPVMEDLRLGAALLQSERRKSIHDSLMEEWKRRGIVNATKSASGDDWKNAHEVLEPGPKRKISVHKETVHGSSDVETDHEAELTVRRRSRRRKARKEPGEDDSDTALRPPVKPSQRAYDSDEGPSRRRYKLSPRVVEPVEANREAASAERRFLRRGEPKREYITETPKPQPFHLPETPQKPSGNRIEAWLTSTPDPFLDPERRTQRRSAPSLSTTEVTSSTAKEHSVVESASSICETSDKPQEEKSQRSPEHDRIRSPEAVSNDGKDDRNQPPKMDEASEASTAPTRSDSQVSSQISSSSSLTRRGAKRSLHSPTKKRPPSSPLRDVVSSTDNTAETSVTSPPSSVTPTSPDSTPKPRYSNSFLTTREPSHSKRLSTIPSADSLASSNAPPKRAAGTEYRKERSPRAASGSGSQLTAQSLAKLPRSESKRKLISHDELMTVLSKEDQDDRNVQKARRVSKSAVSSRSVRSNRSRLETATIGDLMRELDDDETKYMRELRTLVDGVIPVLLNCVLSKSEVAIAAGLFSKNAPKDGIDMNVTKPIVDMGVALRRLKMLHRRIPRHDAESLLCWAQTAQRAYAEYVSAWRLGFQDVVVNLAPADDDKPDVIDDGASGIMMPRNKEGYVVDNDGERVDVAYLLKRPLVRLKYLAKTLKGIDFIKPSEHAAKMADIFQNLVTDARRRATEERARLEDEAAAAIDPTRSRDPRSLVPLAGVRIDPSRCVIARDFFDMHIPHSSGQMVDCRVEMYLRESPGGRANGGDVLICETDTTAKWLFFPPIQVRRISSRSGDKPNELVVMIRGFDSKGKEWNELLQLTAGDDDTAADWIRMLGSTPLPPPIPRRDELLDKISLPPSSQESSLVSAVTASTTPSKSRSPSPTEIEVPFGAPAKPTSKRWSGQENKYGRASPEASPPTTPEDEGTTSSHRDHPPASHTVASSSLSRPRNDLRTDDHIRERTYPTDDGSPRLKRSKARRYRSSPHSPSVTRSRTQSLDDYEQRAVSADPALRPRDKDYKRHTVHSAQGLSKSSGKGYSVWIPPSEPNSDSESSSSEDDDDYASYLSGPPPSSRPLPHRRSSSVPSLDLPTIPKIRKGRQSPEPSARQEPEDDGQPPPPPPHRSPPATPDMKNAATPQFALPEWKTRRHTSSPLKHEYEPSTATESSYTEEAQSYLSESDYSTEESLDELDHSSLEGESSLEDLDATPRRETSLGDREPYLHRPVFKDPTKLSTVCEESTVLDEALSSKSEPRPRPQSLPVEDSRSFQRASPPASVYTTPNSAATLSPSQSASQSPYRTVPSGQPGSKVVALMFCWSDKAGRYEPLHPDDCSILVTPGLIEAYSMNSSQSRPVSEDGSEKERPLLGLELTPLVVLRRNTGLDISVRSPPTRNSRLRPPSNYIMFRSRSSAEANNLYNLINQARHNNPTYIALQNARGPAKDDSWAAVMDRRNAARTSTAPSTRGGSSSSWWQFGGSLSRSKSYRASSTRAPSVASENSIGTIESAMNYLKRVASKKSIFSIGRSTVLTRTSRSAGSFGSGDTASSFPADQSKVPNVPVGITSAKVKFWKRVNATKWDPLGAAILTIMNPDPEHSAAGERQGVGSPGTRAPGEPSEEKRIVVTSKKGVRLLDVTLAENCFERNGRKSIAVSVWLDVVGEDGTLGVVKKEGGVSTAMTQHYILQMDTEATCAYCFSLLGKHRY